MLSSSESLTTSLSRFTFNVGSDSCNGCYAVSKVQHPPSFINVSQYRYFYIW
jgi:hypothetical protein